MARQPGKPPQDKPTCELKSEAECYLVWLALTQQVERLNLAIERLSARKVPQVYMMTQRLESVQRTLAVVMPDATSCHLTNKEQVDRAADACIGLLTRLRFEQFADWQPERSAMIQIMVPLLDRIQIGWKKPAPIPDEVLAQIRSREDARFYNAKPGDWIETGEVRADDEDDYAWRSPAFDLVTDYEWIGLDGEVD